MAVDRPFPATCWPDAEDQRICAELLRILQALGAGACYPYGASRAAGLSREQARDAALRATKRYLGLEHL